MNAIQVNNDYILPKKDFIKRTAIALAMAVLVAAVTIYWFFVQDSILLTVISGVVSVLCISNLLFCFIKPRAWIYRVIAAAVSLFCGYHFYYVLTAYLSDTVFAVPRFVTDFAIQNPESAWLLIVIGIYSVYAAMVFVLSLLVQHIYKKIKNITASAA